MLLLQCNINRSVVRDVPFCRFVRLVSQLSSKDARDADADRHGNAIPALLMCSDGFLHAALKLSGGKDRCCATRCSKLAVSFIISSTIVHHPEVSRLCRTMTGNGGLCKSSSMFLVGCFDLGSLKPNAIPSLDCFFEVDASPSLCRTLPRSSVTGKAFGQFRVSKNSLLFRARQWR